MSEYDTLYSSELAVRYLASQTPNVECTLKLNIIRIDFLGGMYFVRIEIIHQAYGLWSLSYWTHNIPEATDHCRTLRQYVSQIVRYCNVFEISRIINKIAEAIPPKRLI